MRISGCISHVCSSDLPAPDLVLETHSGLDERVRSLGRLRADRHVLRVLVDTPEAGDAQDEPLPQEVPDLGPHVGGDVVVLPSFGSAYCRERVCHYVYFAMVALLL